MHRRCAALLAAALLALAALPSRAGVTRYCDAPATLTPAQQDRVFRFGAVIKQELEASGEHLALIARSGLDLGRFGVRYSHAGISLQRSAETPWSVRQLYYACDEDRPRIFDQGISAFLLGNDTPDLGFVSVVLLPPDAAQDLERVSLDNRLALALLGATYSANAYPYSPRYQNCNQWVAEMLAAAWGGLPGDEEPRVQAQRWLRTQGYEPSVFDVGWRLLMWASELIPWVHSDDHPPQDTAQNLYRVSMPASIESFVQARLSGATRIEFCHTATHVVVHQGWDAIAPRCEAGAGDKLIALSP